MKKILITLISVSFIMTILPGCSSSPYMLDKPRLFTSCSSLGEEGRQKSFETIADVLSRKRGWAISSIDRDNFKIEADVCRSTKCIPLVVSVTPEGDVEFIRNPDIPTNISSGWANNLKRWMDMLEGNYNRRRCRL